MTGAELVGPLPVVVFRGGPHWRDRDQPQPSVAYVPPKNTLDPRYDACTEHRVACDCREAEFAEERAEQRMERKQMQDAFSEILAGHVTRNYDSDAPGCMCTGCQIARACHIYPTATYEASR